MDDPVTRKRRHLTVEEDHAFWAWAVVEVLRATGIRVEELQELSHHSLVQYRLPTTGELVGAAADRPIQDRHRAAPGGQPRARRRARRDRPTDRTRTGAVPLVAAYDSHERCWSTPAPLLLQRRVGTENQAISTVSIRELLTGALQHTGRVDAINGEPLDYTPTTSAPMAITDAILNGLPPHIAQIIAGHNDLSVTLAYKAVYKRRPSKPTSASWPDGRH